MPCGDALGSAAGDMRPVNEALPACIVNGCIGKPASARGKCRRLQLSLGHGAVGARVETGSRMFAGLAAGLTCRRNELRATCCAALERRPCREVRLADHAGKQRERGVQS